MHSGKKGKSGSKKPVKPTNPTWIAHPAKEVEILVTKLAKDKKTASEIGIMLRDSYGIPSVKTACGKRVTQILKEKELKPEIPEDLLAVIHRSIQLRKHFEKNKQDMPAFRGLQLSESKIKRLVKYYVREGVLPVNWKYDSESLKLYGS